MSLNAEEKSFLKSRNRVIYGSAFEQKKSERSPGAESSALLWTPRFALLLIVGLIGALTVFSLLGDYGLITLIRSQGRLEALQEQIQQLNLDEQALKAEIKALKENDRYLEHAIRMELGFSYPNEIIYHINPEQTDSVLPKLILTSESSRAATYTREAAEKEAAPTPPSTLESDQ